METKQCYRCQAVTKRFKSYYVVWKPMFAYILRRKNIAFKSYYVVWKLMFFAAAVITPIMFKSYYVVWKRENPNCQVQAVGVV